MAALTAPELTDLIQEPRFGNRLVAMSEFTADGQEAGMAGYKVREGARIVLSDVIHADVDYIDALAAAEESETPEHTGQQLALLMELLDGTEPPVGLPELSLDRLITDQSWNVTTDADAEAATGIPAALRTDLAIIAHTHPLLHLRRRDPRTLLLPSFADVVEFGKHMEVNPGLIEGTSATHGDLGGIALFLSRAGNEAAPARMQTLNRTTVTENLLGTLGVRTATLTFDRHTGKLKTGKKQLREQIAGLFEPIPV